MTATRGTDRPTLESRLLEATYDAFQFDPKQRAGQSTQKTLAQSMAALLLRRVYETPSERIAELIGIDSARIPTMFEYAQRIRTNSRSLAEIFDRIHAEAPCPVAPKKCEKNEKRAEEKKKRGPKPKPDVPQTEPFDTEAMRMIIWRVGETIGVSPDLITSLSRGLAEANARAVVIGVAHALHPTWSATDIGASVRRDPALARLAARQLAQAIRTKNGTGLYRSALAVCTAMSLDPELLGNPVL